MPVRARVFVLAAVVVVIAAARSIAPPPPSVSGAFGRGTAIVLVHGLGSSAEHWLPTARILAADHRVVLVHLPGHGPSPMPDPFSLARATESLDMALAHERVDRCILVGHSIGGLIAAAEAAEHPERVAGLVLIETALAPQVTGEERDQVLEALDRDYHGLLRAVYGAFGRDSAQGIALYEEVDAMDPETIKPWVRLAVTADLSRAAARIEAPVLAVLAPRSWPAGESWTETAAALGYGLVRQVRGDRVEDCGHFVMMDQPRALAALISRFAADPAGIQVALR